MNTASIVSRIIKAQWCRNWSSLWQLCRKRKKDMIGAIGSPTSARKCSPSIIVSFMMLSSQNKLQTPNFWICYWCFCSQRPDRTVFSWVTSKKLWATSTKETNKRFSFLLMQFCAMVSSRLPLFSKHLNTETVGCILKDSVILLNTEENILVVQKTWCRKKENKSLMLW